MSKLFVQHEEGVRRLGQQFSHVSRDVCLFFQRHALHHHDILGVVVVVVVVVTSLLIASLSVNPLAIAPLWLLIIALPTRQTGFFIPSSPSLFVQLSANHVRIVFVKAPPREKEGEEEEEENEVIDGGDDVMDKV